MAGALPLTVARSRLGDVDDAGVILGLGDPAVAIDRFPDGNRTITLFGEREWNASGSFDRGDVEAIIADPLGWEELAGASWL